MDLWLPFTTWQFAVAAVAITAIITTAKRALRAAAPEMLTRAWCKAVLAMANLAGGVLVALPRGFLLGDTYPQRLLVGLCAGFTSAYVYSALLKRLGRTPDGTAAATPTSEI